MPEMTVLERIGTLTVIVVCLVAIVLYHRFFGRG
jgi:hypothetical protein